MYLGSRVEGYGLVGVGPEQKLSFLPTVMLCNVHKELQLQLLPHSVQGSA